MIFSIDKNPAGEAALVDDSGTSITYGELNGYVKEFGNRIKGRALIFCFCKNMPGSVIGYLGCLENHHVALLLDKNLEQQFLETLVEIYQPSYFWIPTQLRHKITGMFKELIYEAQGYELFSTGNEAPDMSDELSLLLTTSGSMGNPKLVRLSRDNLVSNAQAIADYLQLSPEERPVTSLPMNYTYGLSVINSHLISGGSILLTEKSVVQQEFWDFLKEKKATSFSGVPYTYELLKKIKIMNQDLTSIRYFTQAGGKLSSAMQKEFAVWAKEKGKRFYIMYGQTEATARMSYLPEERCLDKIGSIGIPIPGGRFLIKAPDGNYIDKPDTVGELIYMGSNVSLGYAQCRKDLINGDENNGVLETGDMARKDEDGYYYVVGRKKRFIKIYGVRIGLDECEQLLINKYEGAEFACTGCDDELHIYTTDSQINEQVCSWLSEVLHISRKAFTSHYIEEIPKNNAGKKLYSGLELKN